MSARKRETRTLKASEARAHWSQLLDQVFKGESRILVEKSGIPVAAIVSAADLERLRRLAIEEAAALTRLRAAFADRTEEQIVADVAQVVQEVRSEARARKRPLSA